MPVHEVIPAFLFFIAAAAFVTLSISNRYWASRFWSCLLVLFVLVVLAACIPMDALLDRTTKNAIVFLLCGLVIALPVARALYTRWSLRAELAAQQLAARGNYHGAILLLQRERSHGTPSLLLLNNLAYYLHHVGEIEDALDAVEEAEELYGTSRELIVKKALCLARLGEKEEALDLFTPLVEHNPDDIELAHQYTCLLLHLHLRDEAQRQFDRTEALYFRVSAEASRREWRWRLDKVRRVLEDGSIYSEE